MTNKYDFGPDNAFGFSLVDEDELKAQEKFLQQQVEQSEVAIRQTVQQAHANLFKLCDMFMPLLDNLAQDPDKNYIFWPNRVEKIQKFREQILAFVEDATK